MVDGWGWLASADRQNSTAAEYAARGGRRWNSYSLIHTSRMYSFTTCIHVYAMCICHNNGAMNLTDCLVPGVK